MPISFRSRNNLLTVLAHRVFESHLLRREYSLVSLPALTLLALGDFVFNVPTLHWMNFSTLAKEFWDNRGEDLPSASAFSESSPFSTIHHQVMGDNFH